MTRHAQPLELAELKGATRQNPQRYRGEVPKNRQPLGVAPEWMGDAGKAVWFELEAYALPGVLTASDRLLFEALVTLVVEFRADTKSFTAAKFGQMVGLAARFGLSPADRQKLALDKKPEDNEFNEF